MLDERVRLVAPDALVGRPPAPLFYLGKRSLAEQATVRRSPVSELIQNEPVGNVEELERLVPDVAKLEDSEPEERAQREPALGCLQRIS